MKSYSSCQPPSPTGRRPAVDQRVPRWWALAAVGSALALVALHKSTHRARAPLAALGAARVEQAQDAAATTDATASPTASSSAPHIVFVLVDDLGDNDIGYSSSDLQNVTHAINSLARNGVILNQFYSMHMCTPARAALLTGRYPYRTGMQLENVRPDSPWGLPLALTTLPERLRDEANYRTHAVGKWGLGHYAPEYLPTRRGFDSFYGFLSDEIDYFSHVYPQTFGIDTMRHYTDWLQLNGSNPEQYDTLHEQNNTYSTLLYTRKALDIITNHAAGSAVDNAALFLYYAAQNVHGPLDTPPQSMFTPGQWASLEVVPQVAHRTQIAASLLALDWSVERIVRALREKDMWKRTVLVVASDNGGCWAQGGSNMPLRGGKHFLFEGGVRVPAFVHSELIPPARRGATFNGLFSVVDWYATLLHVAGVEVDTGDETVAGVERHDSLNQWSAIMGNMSGVAHAANATGATLEGRRNELVININSFTLCCVVEGGLSESCDGFLSDCDSVYLAEMRRTNKTRAALRSGEWKIILNEFAQPWFGGINGMDEQGAPLSPGSGTNCGDNPGTMAHSYLFNLTDDPYEQRNLWDIRPDVAARLSARVFDLARHEAVSQWQAETQSAYQQWDMFGGVIRPWCDAVGDACDPPKWGTTPGSR